MSTATFSKMAGWLGRRSAAAPNMDAAPFDFRGGLALDPAKQGLHKPIVTVPLPETLLIPLLDYHFNAIEPMKQAGDTVKRGEWLAHAIPSPASGTISALEQHAVAHPSLLQARCARIAVDTDQTDSSTAYAEENLLTLIETAGVLGLGGAAFPLLEKLRSIDAAKQIDTLIINAAECEPGIACDEALMQEHAQDIIHGVHALAVLTGCERCIIAMEDSKPIAESCMRNALAENPGTQTAGNVALLIIPTRYPTGEESTLIRVVTGKQIRPTQHPADIGVLCVNVATAMAVACACRGQPLDSRIVSLTGDSMPEPCNVRVQFGTSVRHVLEHTGNTAALSMLRLRIGGALSGFDIASADTPIMANSNCIRADRRTAQSLAQPCIRCGDCANVCPANLLPQQLYWFAQADDNDACRDYSIDACIECGCCDLVCPSNIALTDWFRYAKARIGVEQQNQSEAMLAEQRFAHREIRLQQREAARTERLAQRKQQLKTDRESGAASGESDIKAALERARARKKQRPRS